MPRVAVGGRGKVACLQTPLPLGKIVGEGGGSVHSLGERKKSKKGKRRRLVWEKNVQKLALGLVTHPTSRMYAPELLNLFKKNHDYPVSAILCVEFSQVQYIDLSEIVHVVKADVMVASVRQDLHVRTLFVIVIFLVLRCLLNEG